MFAKLLILYTVWHGILTRHVPKVLRYSLGNRIDTLFAELVEEVALAQFSTGHDQHVHLESAVAKNDVLKFMLYALYELKGIDEAKLIVLSEKAAEIGRMLYGWKRGVENKNPPP